MSLLTTFDQENYERISIDVMNMVRPDTGNPRSIKAVIKVVEDLIAPESYSCPYLGFELDGNVCKATARPRWNKLCFAAFSWAFSRSFMQQTISNLNPEIH